MCNINNIRNFSIIAHIDHGKSTISDRLIQQCGGLSDREMTAQTLDSMDLERERGITIKAQSVTLRYKAQNGETYQLNFIDTPGHVDFSYEVSRSLAACEGALLVVDAAQGVEAQTVANCYKAIEQDVVVLPVLNKIDLPQAEPERVKEEITDIVGIDADDACLVSAKTGIGIDALLEFLVANIPAPTGEENKPLQALIIDSWFDEYLGVVSLVRIKSGCLEAKDKIKIMSTNKTYDLTQIGIFTPKKLKVDRLTTGQVGYVVAGIKEIRGAPVGDTITTTHNSAVTVLPGFQKSKPQIYVGLYTINSDDYENFREALAKLSLNDASLFYEPETSPALGFGFRCGFLGLLHMEIIQERLIREYNLDLIATAPSVIYEIVKNDGSIHYVDNPAKLGDISNIKEIREPIAQVNILTPQKFVGNIMNLCGERRGEQKEMLYLGGQISLDYHIPMAEIVLDFFDRVKSVSKGYASLDYNFLHFHKDSLVKLDILINGEKIDALSLIVHRDQAQQKGRLLTEKLKDLIPRQLVEIAIQAAIGSRIISRATVKALRKNVLAKCYGGDITRKKKLLAKQKEGKKRMKNIRNVEIPQEAFLAVLNINKEDK